MSFSNDQYDYFYSEDYYQNQTNIGFGEIYISNYLSENQNNHEKFNSIKSQVDHQSQNEGLSRINKKIKRIKPQSSKPGETKNIPKNIACVMKKFIQKIISSSKDEALRSFQKCRDWIKFKHTPHDKIMKNQIELFIKTPFGKLIGRQFFGNCLWASYFVSENKTNVALYYKYNITYFESTLKKLQQQKKKRKTTKNQFIQQQ